MNKRLIPTPLFPINPSFFCSLDGERSENRRENNQAYFISHPLRLVFNLLLILCWNTSFAGEWLLEEEWVIAPAVPKCSDARYNATYYLTVPDESNGPITGHGKRIGYGCGKAGQIWTYKITGEREGDILNLKFVHGRFTTEGITIPVPEGELVMILEDGEIKRTRSEGDAYWVEFIYKLSGSKIEKWRLVYNGYQVLTFNAAAISERRRKDGTLDQLAGGLKLYWTISVDFKIRKTKKGKTYLGGQGRAEVARVEPFSRPAGVYQCSADESTVPVYKDAFSVDGSVSTGKLKLNLAANGFHVTIDCLFDSDAFKDHLRGLGKTEFPGLSGIRRNMRDLFNYELTSVSGTKSMPLQEHEKTIDEFPLYGLVRTLKKLTKD